MTLSQLNSFLRIVGDDPSLQAELRGSDAIMATQLARGRGFDVCVADFTRYKARATSWRLTDAELEVVAAHQSSAQSYWWQHAWPPA